MELISQDVDITGLQVVNVSMSAEEIATIKMAITNYPKNTPPESIQERLDMLTVKPEEEWQQLTQQEVSDIKEVINKYTQDIPDDPNITLLNYLNNGFHDIKLAITGY